MSKISFTNIYLFSDLLGQWKHYNLSADTLNYRKFL